MSNPLRVLIGGGTGFIGRNLERLIASEGGKVQIITRNPRKDHHLSWDCIAEKGIPKGTDSVINLTGRNVFDPIPWVKAFRDEVVESRIQSNEILVNAIKESKEKPKSFIKISGVGIYEPHESNVYTEDWTGPEETDNFMMQLTREWEEAGKLDPESAKITRQVTIRSGVVLGPDGGFLKNWLPFFRFLPHYFGTGRQWFPWIHIDDLTNLFWFSVTNNHVTGVINGVAPSINTNRQFGEAFAEAFNSSCKFGYPSSIFKLMMGQVRAQMILEGQAVKTRAESLGFDYMYGKLDVAVEDIVRITHPNLRKYPKVQSGGL